MGSIYSKLTRESAIHKMADFIYSGKKIFFFVACLCGSLNVKAQLSGQNVEVSLSTGYVRTQFDWSIAGNSAGLQPDVYSELKWQNLQGIRSDVKLSWNIWNRLYAKVHYGYQSIYSGTVNDQDYGADQRTNPIYDQSFNSDKGNIQTGSINLGYCILENSNLKLIPYVGYSTFRQKLYLLDDSAYPEPLKSMYKNSWNGLSTQVELQVKISSKVLVRSLVGYEQLKYHAEADWNLIRSFSHPLSFKQIANAFLIDGNLSFEYQLNKIIGFSSAIGYTFGETGKGIDTLYLSNGQISSTQFNGAHLKSFHAGAGLCIRF